MDKTKYINQLTSISELSATDLKALEGVSEKFVFRSNDYYQSLIDWDDPDDPIKRIIMPNAGELDEWGQLDASAEEMYTVVPGLEHKYADTALLLVNDVCGGYCRFCFRKRLFMDDNSEVVRDITQGLRYIREHEEITNVLLTGGDPLIMSTDKVEDIIRRVRDIEHVKIIRIGTKMPAFSPARFLNDATFPKMIERYGTGSKKIYIMAHYNHPRELTPSSVAALNLLQAAGAVAVNQTPIIRGVNDKPEVLVELFNILSYIGVPPYYVFQGRPTLGNKPYAIPIEEALDIFTEAQVRCSGLAKRARFVMSHAIGKIEILGKTDEHILMRYLRAADVSKNGQLLILRRNPAAVWLNDYDEFKNLHGRKLERLYSISSASRPHVRANL
jgi:lysine 2,3-aminomutase